MSLNSCRNRVFPLACGPTSSVKSASSSVPCWMAAKFVSVIVSCVMVFRALASFLSLFCLSRRRI